MQRRPEHDLGRPERIELGELSDNLTRCADQEWLSRFDRTA
jgi:hypothetical protein